MSNEEQEALSKVWQAVNELVYGPESVADHLSKVVRNLLLDLRDAVDAEQSAGQVLEDSWERLLAPSGPVVGRGFSVPSGGPTQRAGSTSFWPAKM